MTGLPLVTTTQRVIDFAREAFIRHVEEMLDDPSDLLHPLRDQEPAEVIADLRGLGAELGLDFDALLARGNDLERERLGEVERGEIKPAPREV